MEYLIFTWSSLHSVWNPGRCLLNSTINWTVSMVISVMWRNKWSDWSDDEPAPSSWRGTWYTRLRSSSVGCSNSSWKKTSLQIKRGSGQQFTSIGYKYIHIYNYVYKLLRDCKYRFISSSSSGFKARIIFISPMPRSIMPS